MGAVGFRIIVTVLQSQSFHAETQTLHFGKHRRLPDDINLQTHQLGGKLGSDPSI
jgi:hypothetical protein